MACDLPSKHDHHPNFVFRALLESPINDGETCCVISLHHSQLFGNKIDTIVVNFSQTHVDLARLKESRLIFLLNHVKKLACVSKG